MQFPKMSGVLKTAQTWTKHHSPEILMGVGIAGMVTTTVLAVKATPKAMQLIDEKKKEDNKEFLTPVETVKIAWKPYVPAVITGAVSIGCLLGSGTIHSRRNAALATAYQLSTNALRDYKTEVLEAVGIEKAEEIKKKVAEKSIEKAPEPNRESRSVDNVEKEEELFYDVTFGRLFYSTKNNIDAAVNKINYNMNNLSCPCASLNEFYDELEVDRIDIGEQVGWNIQKSGLLEVECKMNDPIRKNGKLCVPIYYLVEPQYDYWKL